MEVLILGVYLEIFFFRITWSKIRVRIIHGRALYTGKYGSLSVHTPALIICAVGSPKVADTNFTTRLEKLTQLTVT